jgi:hypothetical protein
MSEKEQQMFEMIHNLSCENKRRKNAPKPNHRRKARIFDRFCRKFQPEIFREQN